MILLCGQHEPRRKSRLAGFDNTEDPAAVNKGGWSHPDAA
jgi:hypothetical protein